MVWGDTFIETFTGGRIKDYLSESADDYLNDKKLSERYKTIQLPKEWYIYIFLFSKKKKKKKKRKNKNYFIIIIDSSCCFNGYYIIKNIK